ncbi:50S ribosomal protein L29 [Enterobacteriaceae endosymbiont of Plateumaris consimilis]|uniref:50S ribosomal protein L29 n=1 Tax=Enterobacteriaceae endosymbiont of Plateumaris consimilis TaxID=2675794 RepID=UPI001448F387|nr:50S ribosomal protein L29 [Enterobacteriaceae endosymbiont of Plateumaris consimilis]QJC28681.1 50S ribosomal protein L29 [Enterobacteriaceae endosymbiont of Plateumaris consimilis]
MNTNELLKKNHKELNKELLSLFREQFNLKIQLKSGNLKQTHLLKQSRKNIAKVKTVLSQKKEIINNAK